MEILQDLQIWKRDAWTGGGHQCEKWCETG
jgi:hypothetical protein